MFQSLTDKLTQTIKTIRGKGKLSEKNIRAALNDVRTALLEADVALPVVKDFVATLRQKAIGHKVLKSLSPDQELIRLVKKDLTALMGNVNEELDLKANPPVVILMAGLQGSGKTTSTAKLANYLKNQKKKVMVVSTDIYRPAAIDQLETLAEQVDAVFHKSSTNEKPIDIANRAYLDAKKQSCDVLIVDTAGRLHIDEKMMHEIKDLNASLSPTEVLFVVDSMIGQDAVNTAKAFDEALPLTGVILTKVDGDARGGVALSVRAITGKPIKFLGSGEKVTALQPFYPERVASRILGMGDVLSLIEEAENVLDKEQTQKSVKKLKKGKFDLVDYLDYIGKLKQLGGVSGFVDKLPAGMLGGLPSGALSSLGDDMFKNTEAAIQSMTKIERINPDIIKASRKQRIAKGSGVEIHEINKILKQFAAMQKMIKKTMGKGGGMSSMMKMLGKGLSGGMPGGMDGLLK
tara:strand:- start:8945 stop:10330 length:1386 start_codon:yes stop_codon:yes gene_type:complete